MPQAHRLIFARKIAIYNQHSVFDLKGDEAFSVQIFEGNELSVLQVLKLALTVTEKLNGLREGAGAPNLYSKNSV
jgi:hypothetical protein